MTLRAGLLECKAATPAIQALFMLALLAFLNGCSQQPWRGDAAASQGPEAAPRQLLSGYRSEPLQRRAEYLVARGSATVAPGNVGYYLQAIAAACQNVVGPQLKVEQAPGLVLLRLPAGLAFTGTGASLSPAAAGVLAGMAGVLQDYALSLVEISGHSDRSGDPAADEALSFQRAVAVAQFLEAQGVDPLRFAAVGLGGRQPLADSATPEGRAANRRVELRIVPLLAAGQDVDIERAPDAR